MYVCSREIHDLLKICLWFTVTTIQYDGVRCSHTSCIRALHSNINERAEGNVSAGLGQLDSMAPCSVEALLCTPAGLPARSRLPPCPIALLIGLNIPNSPNDQMRVRQIAFGQKQLRSSSTDPRLSDMALSRTHV